MAALELHMVTFGRYNNAGRLVDTIRAPIDIDTGLFLEPVELEPGTYLVLMPGDILCQVPLIVRKTTAFDSVAPTP